MVSLLAHSTMVLVVGSYLQPPMHSIHGRCSHFPSFLGSQPGQDVTSSSGQEGQPMIRFADIGCGFGGLLIR